jgi:hypothetical protein
MTDIETAFVEAHKLAPDRFAWRTKRDLPEYEKLSKALRDADANGRQLMTGPSSQTIAIRPARCNHVRPDCGMLH